jgi:NADH-quinone oxidoreductase subunit H
MQFGWKILIPTSLIWILIVASLRLISNEDAPRQVLFIFTGVVVVLVTALSAALDNSRAKRRNRVYPEAKDPSFPVPSLPNEISSINVSNTGGDRD